VVFGSRFRLVRVDIILPELYFQLYSVLIISSPSEWSLCIIIWLVGVDVVLSLQYFHHSIMPLPDRRREWCLGSVRWFIRGDTVALE